MKGKQRFDKLIHNGPLFPEKYKAKKYSIDGVTLSPLAEQMLFNFSQKKETDYVKDEVFVANFYSCLKKELPQQLKNKKFPDQFSDCIEQMFKDNKIDKEVKKLANKANKKAIETQKNELKEKYGFAIVDGEKQPINGFMIEPPGIILARGQSPLRGLWKYETKPEDVIINCSENAPEPPAGSKWKNVICNKKSMTLWEYDVQVGDKTSRGKKGLLSGLSSQLQDRDDEKQKKAEMLVADFDKVEAYIYDGIFKIGTMQQALIAYLITRTAIRIGADKDEDKEAMTVGVSTLLKKNMQVDPPFITLDFLGKDSVPYKNTVEIDMKVAEMLKKILNNRKDDEKIFTAGPSDVNYFLKNGPVKGITAKLFRTALGTKMLVDELKKQNPSKSDTEQEKVAKFKEANLNVGRLLNHQKNVGKNVESNINKISDKIETIEQEIIDKKQLIHDKYEAKELELKSKKHKYEDKEYAIKVLNLEFQKNKALSSLRKKEIRLNELKFKKDFTDKAKDIALGTSLGAYANSAIVWSYCNDVELDINKIYSKMQQLKFLRNKDADPKYWRNYGKKKK